MESHLRVELRPRIVAAGYATQAARVNVVERMSNLGQITAPAEGAINTVETVGWTARIGDQEFPVEAYAISPDESGAAVLSLVVMPDSLSIGDPSTGGPAAQVRLAGPQITSWGDDDQPETLGAQVAGHAERVALRTSEPSDGPEKTSAFKRLVRLGPSAVTA